MPDEMPPEIELPPSELTNDNDVKEEEMKQATKPYSSAPTYFLEDHFLPLYKDVPVCEAHLDDEEEHNNSQSGPEPAERSATSLNVEEREKCLKISEAIQNDRVEITSNLATTPGSVNNQASALCKGVNKRSILELMKQKINLSHRAVPASKHQ